jgi:hypothetical protein
MFVPQKAIALRRAGRIAAAGALAVLTVLAGLAVWLLGGVR